MAEETKLYTIRVTEEEAKALQAAAKRFGSTADELVRRFLLRGLQTVVGLIREGEEAHLDDDEIIRRSVRAFIATIPDPSPEALRQLAREYELAARQVVAAGMNELRERIRKEHGNIPNIAALTDIEDLSA